MHTGKINLPLSQSHATIYASIYAALSAASDVNNSRIFMIFNLGHRSFHIFSLQCVDTVHTPFLLSIHSLLNELCWGERQGTPWAGCKCIARLTQRDRRPFTPMLNSISLINVMRRSLDCGRKLEYIKKTHTRQSCPVLCAGSPLHLYWI